MPKLPSPIQALFDASIAVDMDAFLAPWHEDCLMSDSHRKYWGKDAVRRWSSCEWIGDRTKFIEIREVIEHHGCILLFAVLGGEYDAEGLPEDYLITFNFKIVDGKIARALILNSKGRRLGKMTQTRMASTTFSAPMPGVVQSSR